MKVTCAPTRFSDAGLRFGLWSFYLECQVVDEWHFEVYGPIDQYQNNLSVPELSLIFDDVFVCIRTSSRLSRMNDFDQSVGHCFALGRIALDQNL